MIAPRAKLVAIVGLLLLACGERDRLAPSPAAAASASTPRNVLLISLDALRADHLSSYGYERPTSPFLDELAAGGRRFATAFVNTHGTPPSHTTLFTSLYQESHRVSMTPPGATRRDDVAPDSLELLPEILAAAGYLTLGVTGGGFMSRDYNLDQGFARFVDRDRGVDDGRRSLLRLLREAEDDPRPRFVFFHTYEIHSPYRPPSEYRELFGRFAGDLDLESRELAAMQNDVRSHLDESELRHLVALYDAGIRYTDDELRKLFADLHDLGFLQDTLVIVTADHGEEFGDHGGLLHRVSLYEELLHVPLVLHGPGVATGVDRRLASTVDVAPTILAALGLEVPPWMEGRSLLEPWDPPREAVFAQYTDLLYAMRTERWKLIERPPERRLELYDLASDPRETEDLAATEPARARQMVRELRRWRDGRARWERPSAAPVAIPEETRRHLEALGYVD